MLSSILSSLLPESESSRNGDGEKQQNGGSGYQTDPDEEDDLDIVTEDGTGTPPRSSQDQVRVHFGEAARNPVGTQIAADHALAQSPTLCTTASS